MPVVPVSVTSCRQRYHVARGLSRSLPAFFTEFQQSCNRVVPGRHIPACTGSLTTVWCGLSDTSLFDTRNSRRCQSLEDTYLTPKTGAFLSFRNSSPAQRTIGRWKGHKRAFWSAVGKSRKMTVFQAIKTWFSRNETWEHRPGTAALLQ